MASRRMKPVSGRHCEEQSDEAIHASHRCAMSGLRREACHLCASSVALVGGRAFARPVGTPVFPSLIGPTPDGQIDANSARDGVVTGPKRPKIPCAQNRISRADST
jgi:hypothetical protein